MVVLPPPTLAAGKLYSQAQIAVATFLGSPLAGCWFFAANYRALGKPKTANQCLLWGVLGTVALCALGFVLPDSFPRSAIPAAYTVAVAQTAGQIHGSSLAEHRAGGGRLGSWWAVLGVSIVCLAIVGGLLFRGAMIYVLLNPKGAS